MTKKLNFDAIHGHVEHKPAHTHSRIAAELLATENAPPAKKPLDFSAIHGHIQHSPAPTPDETTEEYGE